MDWRFTLKKGAPNPPPPKRLRGVYFPLETLSYKRDLVYSGFIFTYPFHLIKH